MTKLEPLLTRSQEKAEQILRGALPEFLKNGYACTTMDKVYFERLKTRLLHKL